MRYFLRWAVLLCAALAGLQIAPAAAEKRVALVIGNGSYAHIAHLPNVANDAAAMAALLKGAGFDKVEVRLNASGAELRRALKQFSALAADADVAVVFYAGHGIELGQANYLIPVDARLVTDYDVEDEAVPLDRVLQAMEPAKRLRLVILDACRENPFAKAMKRTVTGRSVGRGLGRIEPSTTNTLIAYATRPNAVADDGKGPNSPFTAALIKHLLTPGLDLRLALGRVRDEVLAATATKQEPYVTGSLGGSTVSLLGEAALKLPVAPPSPLLHPGDAEAERAWAAVKDSTSVAELEVVAKRYAPSGSVYADLARARIDELRRKQRAEEERPGRVFRDCADVCPEMVVIPAGSFLMGSSATEIEALVKSVPADSIVRDVRIRWYRSEGPQRRVTFARPFAVGKFEVTFAEWEACVAAGGCKYNPEACPPLGSVGPPHGLSGFPPAPCRSADQGWGRGRRPVLDVSWNDIVTEYLPWLSRKTGKAYRLLTEAEWEYSARAGTATRYAFGDTITRSLARYLPDDGGWKTAEVGSFPANAFGLHDMHGNAGEWVQDCESDSYDGAPSDGSARTTGVCNLRVIRGGSIWATPLGVRSASRSRARPDHSGEDQGVRIMFNGFRVARAL